MVRPFNPGADRRFESTQPQGLKRRRQEDLNDGLARPTTRRMVSRVRHGDTARYLAAARTRGNIGRSTSIRSTPADRGTRQQGSRRWHAVDPAAAQDIATLRVSPRSTSQIIRPQRRQSFCGTVLDEAGRRKRRLALPIAQTRNVPQAGSSRARRSRRDLAEDAAVISSGARRASPQRLSDAAAAERGRRWIAMVMLTRVPYARDIGASIPSTSGGQPRLAVLAATTAARRCRKARHPPPTRNGAGRGPDDLSTRSTGRSGRASTDRTGRLLRRQLWRLLGDEEETKRPSVRRIVDLVGISNIIKTSWRDPPIGPVVQQINPKPCYEKPPRRSATEAGRTFLTRRSPLTNIDGGCARS